MEDAQCDYQFLAPILDTIATMDKQTREFSLKTFTEEEMDADMQLYFDSLREN